MPDTDAILSHYRAVLADLAASTPAGRKATLVAVSKTYGADHIRPLLAAGQRVFGENRVQEAMAKWPELRADYPDVALHLIGPLQTNKVREAVTFFDVIETVDRPRLAEALAKEMARAGRRPDCLVEVNIGSEPQKAGIAPAEAQAFVAACRERWALPVAGLMCIPPAGEDPEPHFRNLAALGRELGLPRLSMGMSADFALAASLGATHVRVGTRIFGAR